MSFHNERGNCVITPEQAIAIFRARKGKNERSPLARQLGATTGLSRKAVRDIWTRRTWRHVTKSECPDRV
jgi:hypothetical protein